MLSSIHDCGWIAVAGLWMGCEEQPTKWLTLRFVTDPRCDTHEHVHHTPMLCVQQSGFIVFMGLRLAILLATGM